ncbi:MAG: alpha-hydroxy acid oxidase [Thermodesulfobacteriota bacterium]
MQPTPPSRCERLEQEAERLLPRMVYEYFAGGAGDETTLRDNRAAFGRLRLRPRFLVDVSARALATTVLGRELPAPLAIAPMAYQRLAHPDGELATVRAAGRAGVPMILSTMATASVEEVGAAASAPLWFQIYVWRDRGATKALVQRAVAAGAEALVVTVDAPRLGTRRRDVDNVFALPDGLRLGNLEGLGVPDAPKVAAGSQLSEHFWLLADASLSWRDLEWFRSLTDLPIVLKGILTAEDARLAAEHGASAVVVSNHGGRQLDGVIATLDALPEVADAAGGALEVWLDGGVRCGADVVKALALGARLVLIGRPVLWALAVGGEQGVADLLSCLTEEVDEALALCGCRSPAEVTRALVAVAARR